MSVASLIERLKLAQTHLTHHEKPAGVLAKNEAFIGGNWQNTPNTPNTPEKEGGQSANQKLTPAWVAPAPAPNPGMAPLLALAMAYCNHTGASDKARQQWLEDVAATPVEQRGELAAYLRSQLPAPSLKAQAPTVAPAPDPAKPLPKFDQAQPWRALDREFQAHYWQCPQCKAAARSGHSDRCATGQQLHDAYIEAA